jgi:PAS domain S-box-containing protein
VTEQRARERLIDHQNLLDAVDQAIIATDLAGRIQYWNAYAETLYGWRADEVLGRSVLEVTPAPEAEALAGEIMATLQAGQRWSGEFTVRRRDGRSFPALVIDSPVIDDDGKLVGVVGVSVDLTERKRAEQSLRLSEERFRATFENAAVGMAHLSLEGRWLRVNERLGQILGLLEEPPVGQGIRDITFREDVPQEEEAMRQLLAGEVASYTREIRLLHGSGEIVWVELTASLVRSASGEPEYVIAVIEDIRERKEAEARLRSALAVKDELLGFVSHELRTPMTVILGMSRLLARGERDAAVIREAAADIADSAEVLSDLLESMLMLARLDREGARQLREPLLLDRAAANVLERQRLKDGSRSYVLKPAPGVLVDVEHALVERVIENMVVNAAKYSHPGRPIHVLVTSEEGSGSVRVIDEGPGVDEKDMDSVFEPFYRASTAPDRASGAGLGLAVSKRIVELLDGTIWVHQHASGGAEFGFALPLLDVESGA